MELSCEQRRKQNIADNRRILAEIGLLNPVNIICIHFYFDRITIPKVFPWRIIPTLTFVHILVRPIFNQYSTFVSTAVKMNHKHIFKSYIMFDYFYESSTCTWWFILLLPFVIRFLIICLQHLNLHFQFFSPV